MLGNPANMGKGDGNASLWVFHEYAKHDDESAEESWIVIVERSRYSLFGFKVVQQKSSIYPGYPGYVTNTITALDSISATMEMEKLQGKGDVEHTRTRISGEEADRWYNILVSLSDITSRVLNPARDMLDSVAALH